MNNIREGRLVRPDARPGRFMGLAGRIIAALHCAVQARNAASPKLTPPTRTILVVQRPMASTVIVPRGSFLVGKSVDGSNLVVHQTELDRHLLIIGGTGCGKTTLIARLFTEEILKWQ